ncbi:MAG: hypothetical protein IPK15_21065 [Verrucomicrobia bacterium]|nr:hypothetical protein [Verrucomicrobiota bacterium]
MLNVSATQELARRVEQLELREARLATLEEKASKLATLEQEMAEMKRVLAQLTASDRFSNCSQRPE